MLGRKVTQTASNQPDEPDSRQSNWRFTLANLVDRWEVPEDAIVIGTSLIVGVTTGLGAVLFIWLLAEITLLAQATKVGLGTVFGTILVMCGSGLVVGAMVERWANEAKGHGVPEVMEAVAIRGGRIRARVATIKVIASSLTIGAGGSAGREGPIVQVGSALGSTVGQWMRFSDERVRTLVACGAAAGIAATFNAPIAGSIFAMEIILGSFTVRYFGAVVISAVSAGVISRAFLGEEPAFLVPTYPLSSLAELPIYVVLGILSAVVAVVFVRVLYAAEGVSDRWRAPAPVKAAIGMLGTAAIGLSLPGYGILGSGLQAIGEATAGNFDLPLAVMASLLIFKMLATTMTLGTGNSGGVFAPSLYMGALLGGITGSVAHSMWPTIVINPGAYAIVGMAAVFAGAARAPITAVLIVFEMSGDYKLIFPLMIATVLSTLVAENLLRESIYTLKLKRKGISLERGRDLDVLQSVTVGEVMAQVVTTVSTDMTLVELSDLFSHTRAHGFPVLDEQGRLWGIVTVTDLDRAVNNGMPRRTKISEIGVPRSRLVVTTPDETMGEALARMGTRGLGRLPVTDRADSDRLVGIIRREDIIRAYDLALSRRAELQHRTKRMHLRNIDGTIFSDILIGPADAAVGKTLADLATSIPRECILVSVRRNGKMLIPHGDTRFQVGDRVTAFVHSKDAETISRCLHGQAATDTLSETTRQH